MEGRQFWNTEHSGDRNRKAKHSTHSDTKTLEMSDWAEKGRWDGTKITSLTFKFWR